MTKRTSRRLCERCNDPIPADHKRFCGESCRLEWLTLERKNGIDEHNTNWRGGKSKHEFYHIYNDMVGRCTRPTHKRYASYGGRGIYVCDRWLADFWNFVDDMGKRPGRSVGGRAEYSLDRIDNDGPYSPQNCRWATYSQQSKNRRATALLGQNRDHSTGRWKAAA
ncbi:hypothetical protein [Nocardia sp. NPDC059239]|uniref:hypothetical protein n=1 Tax=unclassified Nocardia TaxID=2637762 RepID=UPI0036AC374F